MKKLFLLMFGMLTILNSQACTNDKSVIEETGDEWNNNYLGDIGDAPMSGKVNLQERGNIPTVTQNVSNSDGPDFIPNTEVFTVSDNVAPKGAVLICPGGAFMFRSMLNDGYDIVKMLTVMSNLCFIVNYRISSYAMHERTTIYFLM